MTDALPPEPSKSKQSSLTRILRKSAAIALAATLIFLLADAADWRRVAEQVRHANISLLLFSWLVLGSVAGLLRAARWYTLLSDEQRLSFWPVFWANASGNFGNSVLPARAGEFIRIAMVSAKSGLSKRFVLAVAVCERLLDMLVLITLTRIGISHVPGIPLPMQRAIGIAFWGAVGAVTILVLAAQSHRIANFTASHGMRWSTTGGRIWSRLQPFIEGVRVIRSRRRLLLFLALTIPIWLVDAWTATLVATSLGIDLPLPVALVLLAALSCSSVLPTTPGQLGVFQFLTIRVLAIAQIGYDQALTYGLVLQASTYIVLAIWGIPGLWMYKRSRSLRSGSVLDAAAATNNTHPFISH
jgi:uncharacterized protein (TIRG00374 family)